MTVAVDTLRARLERERARRGVPALGAAIVTSAGVSAVAVTGVRVRGGDEQATEHDRWHLGSCGKAITCAHYARLVEDGRSDWDATVAGLLPDLGAGVHKAWREVTIAEVLTHRSGLAADVPGAALARLARDGRPASVQRTEQVALALAGPPQGRGGFRYSNLGYILAGSAIERLQGSPWEEAVVVDLLAPLGIESAGFGPPTGAAPWGHAPRWRGRGCGPALAPHDVEADNPPLMGPAGRLHLTIEDWARFVRLFLGAPADVLRPETVARLLHPAAGSGPRQAFGWAMPEGGTGQEVAFGAQGSNRRWVATVLVADARDRAALVVCNDGRARLLQATAAFALELLRAA